MTAEPSPDARPLQPAPRQPTFLQQELPAAPAVAALLRRGLAAAAASIPPRFFYDELGSHLFAAITTLPEYYPTRTEAELLTTTLPAMLAAAPVHGATLIDLGAGDGEKAARLFPRLRPRHYVPVDISVDYLQQAMTALQLRFPWLPITAIGTDFSVRLRLPDTLPPGQRLFCYPGSSIGNFSPAEAVVFLASVRAHMRQGDVLWLGVDLQKDRAVLERAYDDPLGVTAAFNRNVLRHVDRLAGTDFDVADWRHVAFYDDHHHRIEMHLEAVRNVRVRWPGGERTFAAGERVHTENSYKYTLAGVDELLRAAGLAPAGHWTDARGWFGCFVATAETTA